MLDFVQCSGVVDDAVAVVTTIGFSAYLPQKVEGRIEHQGPLWRNLAFW